MTPPPSSLDALRIDRPPLPPRRGGRGWLYFLLVLLLGGGAAWFFLRPKAPAVKTGVVRQGTAGDVSASRTALNASGYVTARREATVSSKVTGKVTEVLIEEGQKVEAGQVLAKLDAVNIETSLALVEAQLAAAKLVVDELEPVITFASSEVKRLGTLAESRATSRSDFEKAQSELLTSTAKLARQRAEIVVAERQIASWRQQLEDMTIRAPFSGVVTTKNSQPGEMISPMSSGGFTRTGICTLVDMSSLEIEVDVSESYINRVEPNQPVEATLDAYADWRIPCKVIAIIPTADRQKATVKVRIGFDQLDPRILPQMGVKVAFQRAEKADPAASKPAKATLLAPKGSVQQRDGRSIVWVVQNGRVERRAVTTEGEINGEPRVTAGLSAGEVVVIDPPASLADGATVSLAK